MTDHKAEAERLSEKVADAVVELEGAGNNIPIPQLENWHRNATRELARAQVHATLYLAEQTRIGNLFSALHSDLDPSGSPDAAWLSPESLALEQAQREQQDSLKVTIRERLGL